MKKVFFQGTFDILNVCHIKCFKIAKSYGDQLIIGLNSDELIELYKHRIPSIPYEERAIILKSLRYVDKVIDCNDVVPMKQLKEIKPDVFILGEEHVKNHSESIKYVKSYGGTVVTTKNYTKYLHSSDIRKRVTRNELNLIHDRS